MAREPAGSAGSAYTLMQMNLCLSGFAGCYGKVAYPAGVEEAVGRIRAARPDAVTLNESCRGDAARIARRTGYRLRFAAVTVSGRPLRCVRPGGRGRFGIAVLTRAAVERADSRAFAAQTGAESRRWLCVATRGGVDVCTAHLGLRSAAGAAGNDAQCAELAAVLERRAATRAVIFGGDVNRARPCAPMGAWSRSDRAAGQSPGLQSVSGAGGLRAPIAAVAPVRHTDHDVLLVRAQLAAAAR
jgi:endonuclease/exonuclease/phosphatase family metal-dependent hydrolase